MVARKIVVLVDNDVMELPVGDTVDITFDPQFTFKRIAVSKSVTIPIDQQMTVKGDIQVLGNLDIKGEITFL